MDNNSQISINKLKELTEKINLKDLVHKKKDIINYEVECGYAVGNFIAKKYNTYKIQEVFLSKGTNFPNHMHWHEDYEIHEYGIVVSGKVRFFSEDESMNNKVFKEKEMFYFKPGISHSAEVLEDTILLCVVIPDDEGYPDNAA
jgi:quercetin dioxygenase-like cupin family protein